MADDRQTKLEQTMGSVSPARLQATRQEVEVERKKTPGVLPPMDPEPASETTERMKQLDLIQDVQLILIDKYRFGTKVMLGAVAMMALCLAGLTGLVLKNYELYDHILALQSEQQKLIERGEQLEKKTDEAKEKLEETKQTIDETKEKVDQAVEEAPKIEIDEAGKARVVLPVRGHKKKAAKMPPKTSNSAAPQPTHAPATAPLPAQIPLETKSF